MTSNRRPGFHYFALRVTVPAILVVLAVVLLAHAPQAQYLASVPLADGRILHIDGVTYGTEHRTGQHDYYHQLFYWLPLDLGRLFAPKKPEQTIRSAAPALVVWVEATDAVNGKSVDCQRVRVEFVDRHGELWGEETSECCWFGTNFDRVGHVFNCFPRDEKTLTLRVTTWKKKTFGDIRFQNPAVSRPAAWVGQGLPQRQTVGGVEIVLDGLTLATNGGDKEYWATPARYWNPSWRLLRDGLAQAGWDGPEWEAEDPLGNKGQLPNVWQPALRFTAKYYPSPTNSEAAPLLAALPKIDLTSAATNWWNRSVRCGSGEIAVLGCFPAGTHVFCEGRFVTNNPGLGPTRGGAPSGWTGQEKRVNVSRLERLDGHYTPTPTIYLRVPAGVFGVRLRDEQGRCWPARPEPEGDRNGILPFLLSPPPEVRFVTPEIVALKPVAASFAVKTEPPGK